MRNPLQDQLLKAGLVKKSKVAQVVREQTKQRQGKAKASADTVAEKVDVQRLQAERVERDRALAAERNAQARLAERSAQIRQIIETQQIKHDGDIAYRFVDGDKIKNMLINAAARSQLLSAAVLIVRYGDGFALVPRAAAEKVRERDPAMIVLDNAHRDPAPVAEESDPYYARFQVPDDLIW